MSGITMRLDTAALRAMIEENPEFKLEIQKNVLDNINRDHLDECIRQKVEALLLSMCEKGGSYYTPIYTMKDKNLVSAITTVVGVVAEQIAAEKVKTMVTAAIQDTTTLVRRELRTTIKDAILDTVTPEMAKEILIAKLV